MASVITLQRYIQKCDDIIASADIESAEMLEEEIISVLNKEINGLRIGLSNYAPCMLASTPDGRTIDNSANVDYIGDIKLLRSKLQMELEKNEAYSQTNIADKKNKVFISHATKDSEYVSAFVNLLEDIGLSEDEIVCSSISGYGIPLGEDIYDWLSSQFQEFNLHVIFMLSENYYKSVACLNEMGAAWVLKQKYDSILLPNFDFPQIKGAINPNKIGIKLDSEENELNHRLNELKDNIIEEFNLKTISATKWERHRNEFSNNIKKIVQSKEKDDSQTETVEESKNTISSDAAVLLVYSANSSCGQVTRLKSISGLSVCGGNWNFVGESATAREESRWEDAVNELENYGLIEALSCKRQIFRITTTGYKVADEVKEKLNIDTELCPDEYLIQE